MTPYLDPLGLGEGVKVGEGSRLLVKVGEGTRSGVKGRGGVKVVGQGRGQGCGRVRVKVRGIKGGGHGWGSRGWSQGAVGFSGWGGG